MTDREEQWLQNVQVPLSEVVVAIAEKSARAVVDKVLEQHMETCPIVKLADTVDKLKDKFHFSLGYMLGAGTLGGAAGALISKLLM